MPGARLSRRKIANYVARELMLGDSKQTIEWLAAFLLDTKRTRELELLVRDIEYSLYDHSEAIIDVTSAHPLTKAIKDAISRLAIERNGASTVYLRGHIDSSVIGGVRVEYGGQQLDATLRYKLDKLRTKQV